MDKYNGYKTLYDDLLYQVRKNLVVLLGENYYTINSDTYSSNREMIEDIRSEYDRIKRQRNVLAFIDIVMIVIFVIILILTIFY